MEPPWHATIAVCLSPVGCKGGITPMENLHLSAKGMQHAAPSSHMTRQQGQQSCQQI